VSLSVYLFEVDEKIQVRPAGDQSEVPDRMADHLQVRFEGRRRVGQCLRVVGAHVGVFTGLNDGVPSRLVTGRRRIVHQVGVVVRSALRRRGAQRAIVGGGHAAGPPGVQVEARAFLACQRPLIRGAPRQSSKGLSRSSPSSGTREWRACSSISPASLCRPPSATVDTVSGSSAARAAATSRDGTGCGGAPS
jgi:hypothetical protein